MADKTRQIALPGTLLVRDAGVYLLWRIPGLAVDVGQKAVLGIRPERIDRVPLEQPADRPTMGHATVTLAEPMGALVVLWLDLGVTQISAIAESHTPHQRGHTLGVQCGTQRLSLFGEDGKRL